MATPESSTYDDAAPPPRDRWAAWLLEHRFGGDPVARDQMLSELAEYRDRVLSGARIQTGDVVLDVGCGDGLLGVPALDLVGDNGTVSFCDVSVDLLEQCRRITTDLGHADRCRFVHTGLPDLADIATESVDVAMTRSVLIYVDDKAGAFAALHRVLRPGGRLSIFEPINAFGHPAPANLLHGLDVSGLEHLADKVRNAYNRHYPANNPMTDFDERDLRHAEDAGFGEVHLDYHVDIDHETVTTTWPAFLRYSPNPLVPPLTEVLSEALTATERDDLGRRLQEQLAAGRRRRRFATAYLRATR